jgi:DNA modification methylase
MFDPFAGWGNRVLGASVFPNVKYVGVDANPLLKNPHIKLLEFLNNENLNIVSSRCENFIKTNDEQYDLCLTSPPYFTKGKLLEKYQDTEKEGRKFYEECLVPLLKWMKTHVSMIALHLPKDMVKSCVDVLGQYDEVESFSCRDKIYVWRIKT